MKVSRLIYQGGNLMVTLPRELLRELALVRRQYVRVERTARGSILITPLRRLPDDRGERSRRRYVADR